MTLLLTLASPAGADLPREEPAGGQQGEAAAGVRPPRRHLGGLLAHRPANPRYGVTAYATKLALAAHSCSESLQANRGSARSGIIIMLATGMQISQCAVEHIGPRSEPRHAAQAMGVLAFELIVGRPPFERESRSSTYEAIMYRRPHFPLWISDAARKFITLALVKVCA